MDDSRPPVDPPPNDNNFSHSTNPFVNNNVMPENQNEKFNRILEHLSTTFLNHSNIGVYLTDQYLKMEQAHQSFANVLSEIKNLSYQMCYQNEDLKKLLFELISSVNVSEESRVLSTNLLSRTQGIFEDSNHVQSENDAMNKEGDKDNLINENEFMSLINGCIANDENESVINNDVSKNNVENVSNDENKEKNIDSQEKDDVQINPSNDDVLLEHDDVTKDDNDEETVVQNDTLPTSDSECNLGDVHFNSEFIYHDNLKDQTINHPPINVDTVDNVTNLNVIYSDALLGINNVHEIKNNDESNENENLNDDDVDSDDSDDTDEEQCESVSENSSTECEVTFIVDEKASNVSNDDTNSDAGKQDVDAAIVANLTEFVSDCVIDSVKDNNEFINKSINNESIFINGVVSNVEEVITHHDDNVESDLEEDELTIRSMLSNCEFRKFSTQESRFLNVSGIGINLVDLKDRVLSKIKDANVVVDFSSKSEINIKFDLDNVEDYSSIEIEFMKYVARDIIEMRTGNSHSITSSLFTKMMSWSISNFLSNVVLVCRVLCIDESVDDETIESIVNDLSPSTVSNETLISDQENSEDGRSWQEVVMKKSTNKERKKFAQSNIVITTSNDDSVIVVKSPKSLSSKLASTSRQAPKQSLPNGNQFPKLITQGRSLAQNKSVHVANGMNYASSLKFKGLDKVIEVKKIDVNSKDEFVLNFSYQKQNYISLKDNVDKICRRYGYTGVNFIELAKSEFIIDEKRFFRLRMECEGDTLRMQHPFFDMIFSMNDVVSKFQHPDNPSILRVSVNSEFFSNIIRNNFTNCASTIFSMLSCLIQNDDSPNVIYYPCTKKRVSPFTLLKEKNVFSFYDPMYIEMFSSCSTLSLSRDLEASIPFYNGETANDFFNKREITKKFDLAGNFVPYNDESVNGYSQYDRSCINEFYEICYKTGVINDYCVGRTKDDDLILYVKSDSGIRPFNSIVMFTEYVCVPKTGVGAAVMLSIKEGSFRRYYKCVFGGIVRIANPLSLCEMEIIVSNDMEGTMFGLFARNYNDTSNVFAKRLHDMPTREFVSSIGDFLANVSFNDFENPFFTYFNFAVDQHARSEVIKTIRRDPSTNSDFSKYSAQNDYKTALAFFRGLRKDKFHSITDDCIKKHSHTANLRTFGWTCAETIPEIERGVVSDQGLSELSSIARKWAEFSSTHLCTITTYKNFSWRPKLDHYNRCSICKVTFDSGHKSIRCYLRDSIRIELYKTTHGARG